eukprot:Blabericola_migrator_1__5446@NODE_2785_length_2354_cov_991_862702_g1746_i0_p2_GENE_NODE_2785_length_2354_cov_991_862702_g1746_i0NODE_2785_length_2354_cov_991_862702_g1746_i0_p2_ORF_typecomplete_len184_score35_84_NODE_2785_length_2354_cov_991_862702_g1746_i010641615
MVALIRGLLPLAILVSVEGLTYSHKVTCQGEGSAITCGDITADACLTSVTEKMSSTPTLTSCEIVSTVSGLTADCTDSATLTADTKVESGDACSALTWVITDQQADKVECSEKNTPIVVTPGHLYLAGATDTTDSTCKVTITNTLTAETTPSEAPEETPDNNSDGVAPILTLSCAAIGLIAFN